MISSQCQSRVENQTRDSEYAQMKQPAALQQHPVFRVLASGIGSSFFFLLMEFCLFEVESWILVKDWSRALRQDHRLLRCWMNLLSFLRQLSMLLCPRLPRLNVWACLVPIHWSKLGWNWDWRSSRDEVFDGNAAAAAEVIHTLHTCCNSSTVAVGVPNVQKAS